MRARQVGKEVRDFILIDNFGQRVGCQRVSEQITLTTCSVSASAYLVRC